MNAERRDTLPASATESWFPAEAGLRGGAPRNGCAQKPSGRAVRLLSLGLWLALAPSCASDSTERGTSGGAAGFAGATPAGGSANGGASAGQGAGAVAATGGAAGGGLGGTHGVPPGASGGTANAGAGTANGGGGAASGGTAGSDGLGGSATGGLVGGNAGTGAGGQPSPSGGAPSSGGSANAACTAECLEQCVAWGGTERAEVCDGALVCCDGATPPPPNPLAHLIPSAEEVGLLLARRFAAQPLAFGSVANLPGDGYKTACEWYGALGVASATGEQAVLDALVQKFEPLEPGFTNAMVSGEAHVDRYIFGMVPLEIYLRTGDASYLPLGTEVADLQQTTNQTRDAIDDMFMMTGLQVQAYRATNDPKYLGFMAQTMVDYLGAQQPNGLFFHNVSEARVYWGRGNGWFAAGMAELLRDLPASSADYATIEAAYRKMMDGLLPYRGPSGLWYQVLNLPEHAQNWEESSGSAMFAYAMVAGVRRGILDAASYVPVIEAAWAGLRGKLSAQGDVRDVCVGTWYQASAEDYMALARLTGDGHGQAPLLWVAAELLR